MSQPFGVAILESLFVSVGLAVATLLLRNGVEAAAASARTRKR